MFFSKRDSLHSRFNSFRSEHIFFHFITHRTNLEERMGNCCSGLQKDDKNRLPPPDRQSGPPPPPPRGRDDDRRGGGPGPGAEGRQRK